MINLGFSAAGTMAPPVAEPLAELDPAAYVIDCTWNMGDGPGGLPGSHRPTRANDPEGAPAHAHPLRGPVAHSSGSHPTDLTRRQEAAVRSLQEEGVEGLILVPGTDLIGDDGEGTVDGVHLNDLGMDRQARCLLPIVRQALDGPARGGEE